MNDHIPDANKMVSDTPRTESFNCYDNGCDNPLHAWGAFSAELERELNASNAIIRQQQLLDEYNLRLQERIKRLEEAGDELLRDNEDMANINRWHKAKYE